MASAPTDLLRNELERLFELEGLQSLTTDLLGLDPNDVGGNTGKAPFARALVERCARDEMLEALADAIVLRQPDAAPRLKGAFDGPMIDDIQPGSTVAGFKISKKTHDEGFGSVFSATSSDGKQVTLKVLRDAKVRDRRGLHRFLTAQRALKAIDHHAVTKVLGAGLLPDGRPYLATEFIDGQLLSTRLGRVGAMHINEARPVLEAISEGLDLVHASGIMHSDLRPEHVVLVRRDGKLSGVLVDWAVDRMAGSRGGDGQVDTASLVVLMGSARTLAPERARSGAPADVRSDVYALGVLTYEILTGKPPFTGSSPIDLIVAHITQTADPPSKAAPRGWVTKDIDVVVLKALSKDPKDRFPSASAFVAALVEALSGKRLQEITREEFENRRQALFAAPHDDEKAMALEGSGAQGIPWPDVYAALVDASDKSDDEVVIRALTYRAARVAQLETKELQSARDLYEKILILDENDEIAKAKLYEVRLAMATPEEKAEILLEEVDKEQLPSKRAEMLRELASVYEKEIKDIENALVALTQALTDSPADETLAKDIERLAGDDKSRWNDTLQTVSQAVQGRDPATGAALLVRAGRWYGDRLSRPDFAVACFTQALSLEAGNDGALEGAAQIYRKAQQWNELIAVLLKRADAQASPVKAREIRADAADLIESKGGDAKRARELLEKILDEDPAQPKATQSLERIYLAAKDWAGLVKLLERKADALSGPAKADALNEIAEVYEDHLSNVEKSADYFEQSRQHDPKNMGALKGLERLYARGGDPEKLLRVLESQVAVAATPRQKVELWSRIGAIYEEEFVDHAKAAQAFESAIAIDAANDAALTGVARTYRLSQRWEDLVGVLDKHANVVEHRPRKADLLVSQARLLIDQIGSPDRAAIVLEKALEIDPNHDGALELAARVRATRGDVKAATEALDQLAARAKTPNEKAEAYFRTAKILEEKGDRDGAIERYKRAIDADESFAPATARLRDLYSARGDSQGAIDMLMREIEAADGVMARAKLWSDVARIHRDRTKDLAKAMDAAQKAVLLDATNEEASGLLGELKFDDGAFAEAAKLLAVRAVRAKDLGKDEGLRIALRYGEALAKSGDETKALEAFRMAKDIAPNDRVVLLAVANSTYGIGKFEQAKELYSDLQLRFGRDFEKAERVELLFHLGQAAIKTGDGSAAVRALTDASDTDPSDKRVLDALCEAYGQQSKWEDVVRIKRKRIEAAGDSERYDLHVELGEIFAAKLNDKTKAAKAFVSALETRPDDRKLLMKLMQLYSDVQDWGRLVEIILRMADLTEDKGALARYYLTAAQLCHKQLNRSDEAIDYYEQALEHDASNVRAVEGIAELRTSKKDFAGLEQSYQKVLARLGDSGPAPARAQLNVALGDLYSGQLNSPADAIVAYEKAQELDSTQDLSEKLAALYLKDSKRHFEKAAASQRALLQKNPQRAESYRALRKLYTEQRRPDEAWCLCQALFALKAAEPEEENFFKKFRTDTAAVAAEKLNDELWTRDLIHAQEDVLITALFATITPAVLAARGESRESYGLGESDKIDPASDQGQMAQTIHYAAGVLGIKTPIVYAKPSDDSGLNLMHTNPPAIFLGRGVLAGGPAQPLAFLAGNKLAYFRQGHYIRQMVPTGTGLRAWLFSAIRLVNRDFPVTPELNNAVSENAAIVKQHVTGPKLDVLTSLVTKLLGSQGSLDLKRWTIGVDLTADRTGLLLANDLPRSLAMIRATPEDSATLPHKDRIRELTSFAVSESYFHLRQRLGIAIRVGG